MTITAASNQAASHQPSWTLERALVAIAAGADDRDRDPQPAFPAEAFELLASTGVMSWNAVGTAARPPAADELALVRSVARADASVGRIFDGHLNAAERLAVQAPAELAEAELEAIRSGRLLAGVWGGDPTPGEGEPARLRRPRGARGRGAPAEVISGVKTFCSGAGGLHRALVLAGSPEGGPPVSVWVDLENSDRVEVDPSWYRSSGLRASVSHRVRFHDAPVVRLGPAGAISEQPWFARDALRTAASWAGMADAATDAAIELLSRRPAPRPLEELAAGRILAERATIDAWLARAAAAMDDGGAELPAVALNGRAAIAGAGRRLLGEAAAACGSHPFATGGALDRARRDLELFLLQHRLDPLLARSGAAALQLMR